MKVRTFPVIEGKVKKDPRRLCKDCAPADWIACYEHGAQWRPCDKRKAAQARDTTLTRV